MAASVAAPSSAAVTARLSRAARLTRQRRVATLPAMSPPERRPAPPPSTAASRARADDGDAEPAPDARPTTPCRRGDRRARTWRPCRSPGSPVAEWPASLGALLAAWIVIVFVRQVGEAAAATTRAERSPPSNAGDQRAGRRARARARADRRDRATSTSRPAATGSAATREIAFTLDPPARRRCRTTRRARRPCGSAPRPSGRRPSSAG